MVGSNGPHRVSAFPSTRLRYDRQSHPCPHPLPSQCCLLLVKHAARDTAPCCFLSSSPRVCLSHVRNRNPSRPPGEYDWELAALAGGGPFPFLGSPDPSEAPRVVALLPEVDTACDSHTAWTNTARGLVQVGRWRRRWRRGRRRRRGRGMRAGERAWVRERARGRRGAALGERVAHVRM